MLFDDDHYYLGGVLAELLATEGYRVTLITPASDAGVGLDAQHAWSSTASRPACSG